MADLKSKREVPKKCGKKDTCSKKATDYSCLLSNPKELLNYTKNWLKECIDNNQYPSVARYAYSMDMAKGTLYNNIESYPLLQEMIIWIKTAQEIFATDKGFSGETNANFCQFMLSNIDNNEYKLKQHIDQNVNSLIDLKVSRSDVLKELEAAKAIKNADK